MTASTVDVPRDHPYPEFEYPLASQVAPTLTALEMHPGLPMLLENPLFPDEITVAILAERRLSITALVSSPSASQLA